MGKKHDYAALIKKHRSKRAAAKAIDIPEATFRYRLKKQEETDGLNKLGLKMIDAEAAIMDDHMVSGISRYYKLDDGGIWVKTNRELIEQMNHFDRVGEAMLKDMPARKAIERTTQVKYEDLMSCYVLSDFHLGMFSNHDPDGPWNTRIAQDMLYRWFDHIVDNSMNTHTGVFVQLGDFFHCNGKDSVTPASKHVLDTDTTWGEVVDIGMDAMEYGIEKMLAKHEHVHLIIAEANHDPDAAVWMQRWFDRLYRDNPRLTVDCTNNGFYAYKWGETSIWAHHGHMRNINDVSKTFVGLYPKIYGDTKYRYGHIGHFHHAKRKPMGDDGLIDLKIHTTLAAKDQYAVTHGYISGRGARVEYYHKYDGFAGNLNVTPSMLL
jgi:hypothetical protein